MPAEPTKAKLKRRSSRREVNDWGFDDGHARELELKRNRGEVSCAECRRLKIKCDKQIPCQSCKRRGCAALCPNGSLATGQGTRFVLAATEHLHRKNARLNDRIRLLEDALASLHSRQSDEPHPLLHEDLLSGNTDDRGEDGGMSDDMALSAHGSEVIDAFGTLSISDLGISRFFGPTGGSESLLLTNISSPIPDNSVQVSDPSSRRDSLSPSDSMGDMALFSQSFPFTPMGRTADVQEMIRGHLPSYDRALNLCNTYFEQHSWLFRGVTSGQLVDEMLPVIYHKRPAQHGEDYAGPHALALLFIIFAVAALVEDDPSAAQAEHYQQISMAAVSLQPVLEKPSIVTIQTLHLMSIYNAMSGSDLTSETTMEMTWSLITLAAHLCQTIGLHRDSERWGLSPKMVHRRRILFWDVFVADVWQSLNTGRPPSFSLGYIDCGLPQYDIQTDKTAGIAYEIWSFRFASECVAEVTARTLTAEAPTYDTIMELDRKVREFPLPEVSPHLNDMATSFQRCVLEHIKETVLVAIHRSFFAQAIIEQPTNPLKSVYAPSFLAAYRSSATILKSIREQFKIWPKYTARLWVMWTFAFSAAVVFGTVVTRGPRSPLAASAMVELDQACLLFSKAATYSKRAAKALPILTRLSAKAHHALTISQSEPSLSGNDPETLWNIKKEDSDDELSIFAGRTRFVSAKRVPNSSTLTVHTMDFDGVAMSRGPPTSHAIQPIMAAPVQREGQRHPLIMNSVTGWTNEHRHREGYANMNPPPPGGHMAHRVQFSDSYDRRRDSESSGEEALMWSANPFHHGTARPTPQFTSSQHQGLPELYNSPLPPHIAQSYRQVPQQQMYTLQPSLARGDGEGLGGRDPRLDVNWDSVMQHSGQLDGVDFRA